VGVGVGAAAAEERSAGHRRVLSSAARRYWISPAPTPTLKVSVGDGCDVTRPVVCKQGAHGRRHGDPGSRAPGDRYLWRPD